MAGDIDPNFSSADTVGPGYLDEAEADSLASTVSADTTMGAFDAGVEVGIGAGVDALDGGATVAAGSLRRCTSSGRRTSPT